MAFHATFPDLPGCRATAATFDAAHIAAGKALGYCLATMEDAGDAIPEPSTLSAVVGGVKTNIAEPFSILVREDAA